VQLLDGCIVIGPQRDDSALRAIATLAASLELHRRKLGYGALRERPDLVFDRYNVRTPALAFFAGDVGHSPVLVVEAMNANEQVGVMRAKLDRYLDFGVPTALGLDPATRCILIRSGSGRSENIESGPLSLPSPLGTWEFSAEVLWPEA
jgi:hypothetical protein